jgi:hypothetical protein
MDEQQQGATSFCGWSLDYSVEKRYISSKSSHTKSNPLLVIISRSVPSRGIGVSNNTMGSAFSLLGTALKRLNSID